MVVQEHGKWVVKSSDGSKTLGEHPSKEEADKQLMAIEAAKHSRGDSVFRYDVGELRKPNKTQEGWLRVDGRLTRTGVFVYRNLDGSERRELRLPEEVFKTDVMESFGLVPLTLDHPDTGYLDATNTSKYAKGAVSGVHRDGHFVAGSMLVTDAEAVRAIESGAKRELSCGYFCDLEKEPGVYQGQRYDAIQRNIRGNHVALVSHGRAGPEARVRMDTRDAVMVGFCTTSESESAAAKTEHKNMEKITIDGVEFEVSTSAAQAFRKFDASRKDERNRDADVMKQLKADGEKAAARADQAESDLKKEKTARADAEDPKKLRAAIATRVSLESKAREFVGAEVKLDEMSERDVKIAVLAKLSPEFKADGKSDDYVSARFDAATESASKRNSGLEAARSVTGAPAQRTDAAPSEKDARTNMLAGYRDAWKTPAAK
jgi:hypothetical protein